MEAETLSGLRNIIRFVESSISLDSSLVAQDTKLCSRQGAARRKFEVVAPARDLRRVRYSFGRLVRYFWRVLPISKTLLSLHNPSRLSHLHRVSNNNRLRNVDLHASYSRHDHHIKAGPRIRASGSLLLIAYMYPRQGAS
jgi:hypothetical protein